MRIFLNKNVKITAALGVLPPEPPIASGGSAPRSPRYYSF